MKALIAVTCVAVLVAIGYFFWNEYAEAQRLAALQERQNLEASCRAARDTRTMPTVTARCREMGYLD